MNSKPINPKKRVSSKSQTLVNVKNKNYGLYVAVSYVNGAEKALICEASSKQEAIRNMLGLYSPPKAKTYAVELDIYNVTKHRKLYENITDTRVVTYTLEHDGATPVHTNMYMIHPVQPQCTGKHKIDHRYAFEGMSFHDTHKYTFKEKCLDCYIEKTTTTGLETDYGSAYYSIRYDIPKETLK